PDGEDAPRDRLASPLVVKALSLADGRFVPCALWLHRAYPSGKVALFSGREPATGLRGAAPFDRLVAPGDTPRIRALRTAHDLRSAFLDWLQRRRQTTTVAP